MMIDYEFFYNVAVYANENWKGGMSTREIACNAYELLISFEESKANGKLNGTMDSLCVQLFNDACWTDRYGNDNDANKYYNAIMEEIFGKENTKMFMTDLHKTELLEKAIAYINDNDMLEDFIEDTGIDFTDKDYEYFGIEKPEREYEVEFTGTVTVMARSKEEAVEKGQDTISIIDMYAYIDGECIN